MKTLNLSVIGIFIIALLSNTIVLPHYVNADYPPPLQQVKQGIPLNQIKCNPELVNIFKKAGGEPACVALATAVNLVDRGSWLMHVQTVWYRYPTLSESAPWSDVIPSDLWKNYTEQCVMDAAMWKYFKNQDISPLEIRFNQGYYDTRGGPNPAYPSIDFFVHVLSNDSSTMNKLGFNEFNVPRPDDFQPLPNCKNS